jgi:hypothetical protein
MRVRAVVFLILLGVAGAVGMWSGGFDALWNHAAAKHHWASFRNTFFTREHQWSPEAIARLRNRELARRIFDQQSPPSTTITPPFLASRRVPATALTEVQFDSYLAQAGWPRALWKQVKKVASCESGWNPSAVGRTKRFGDDRGLLQVSYHFHRLRVREPDLLFDPLFNLTFSRLLYEESGWKPWRPSAHCHGLH